MIHKSDAPAYDERGDREDLSLFDVLSLVYILSNLGAIAVSRSDGETVAHLTIALPRDFICFLFGALSIGLVGLVKPSFHFQVATDF